MEIQWSKDPRKATCDQRQREPSDADLKKEEKAIDISGHYDQDGASYTDQGVIIATEPLQNKKPDQ